MTGPYAQAALGNNISQMETQDDAQDEAIRSFERGAVEPLIKPTGLIFDCLNSVILNDIGATALGITEAWARWNGTIWQFLLDPTNAQINAGGTVRWYADQSLGGTLSGGVIVGGHKFTGMSPGSALGHSVVYEQVMLLSGVNAMADDLNMGTHKITGGVAGSAPTDFVIKSQLGTGVPDYAADMYFQTNYDVRGNGFPVVVQTQASPTTTFTQVGKVPRRLTVRLYGEFRKQSDGTDANCDDQTGQVYVYNRWDPDATGGDPGTDGAGGFVVGTVAPTIGGAPHIDIIVIAKLTAPYGYWLKFLRSDGEWCDLKKIGSGGATRGTIQVITEQGEGT